MRAFLRRVALSLAGGIIFVYWCELTFWARPHASTSPAEMVEASAIV